MTAPVSLAALLLLSATAADAQQPTSAELACNQEPGRRFYWVERAFCDLEMSGPERAQGVVIWNHGISGTNPSWRAPAPPAFRLLQARLDVRARCGGHLTRRRRFGMLTA